MHRPPRSNQISCSSPAGSDYEKIFNPEFYKAANNSNWDALPDWKKFIEANLTIPSTKIPIIFTTGGKYAFITEERARALYNRIKQAGNDITWLFVAMHRTAASTGLRSGIRVFLTLRMKT